MKIVCHKVCQLAPFFVGMYLVYQFHRNHVTILILPCRNFQTIINPYLGDPEDLASEMHGRFELLKASFICSINAWIKSLTTVVWKSPLLKLWSCFWRLRIVENNIILFLRIFNLIEIFQIFCFSVLSHNFESNQNCICRTWYSRKILFDRLQ